MINQDCGVWFWWGAGGVDYGGVDDGDGGGVVFVAGGEEKKKQGECERRTNGFRHFRIVAERWT